jgi:hypothetical protein
MADDNKILQLATEARKFQIDLFWQRSLFFWGLIAATFLAYANLRESEPEIRYAVICVGLIFSLGWTLVNRVSKYWQEVWEQKVEEVEELILVDRPSRNPEPTQEEKFWLWSARKYSVSKLAIALSDFTLLIWLFLGIEALAGRGVNPRPWRVMLLLTITTIAYAGLMLLHGRTTALSATQTQSPPASDQN